MMDHHSVLLWPSRMQVMLLLLLVPLLLWLMLNFL